jgi:glycolate oxidase FAD binding subunit
VRPLAADAPAGADGILGVAAAAVAEPATVEEAAELLGAAARDRKRVAFVGGGTDLGIGAAPAGLDLLVRTRKLTRVVEYAPSDQIVVAEAGLPLAELQARLAAEGQRLALDPPRPERATLGGVVAANAFGALRTRYGSVRDLIIGVTLVRADGVVARGGGKVVKNVAGFDLARLIVGSLGTLALVATVNFRLHPLPETAATVLLPDLPPAAVKAMTAAVREAQLEPAAAVAIGVARLDLGVRFEGFEAGVRQQTERLLALAARLGARAEPLDAAAARSLWARHDALRASDALVAKLSAPPALVEALSAEAAAPLAAALSGGTAVLYPTLGLAFVTGEPASPRDAAAALERARAALIPRGGSLVLHAAPPAVRALVDPWGPPAASFPLMRRLKEALDPEGRLAPGRFVGGL